MATPDQSADDIFLPGGKLRPDLLQDSTANVLREAIRYARSTCWDSVRSPHVFMGLLAAPDPGVHYWGDRLGADLPRLLEQFAELFHQEEEEEPVLSLHREFLSDNVIKLLREALGRAKDHQRTRITPMDLLVSLFTTPNSIVAECFERIGVTAAKLTELAVIAEQQMSKRGPAPA
jgi:ATP-dependent Clp protease ATP-binding subunit ClpA